MSDERYVICSKEGDIERLKTLAEVQGEQLKGVKEWLLRIEKKIDTLVKSNGANPREGSSRVRAATILGICSIVSVIISGAFLYFTYHP